MILRRVMSDPQLPTARSRTRPQPRTSVGRSAASAVEIVILGILMAAVVLLGLYGLWRFWPAAAPATGAVPATAKFSYFSWNLSLTRDQQFFVITALAGVIGAMLHGLRSLSNYIGERYLFRSWIPYYVLLPLVGGILATIVYLVLRAGLLPGATSASQPDPDGIADIAMPSITGFDPQDGPPGTSVVISGSNLTSVTGVAFTGAEAPQPKIDS